MSERILSSGIANQIKLRIEKSQSIDDLAEVEKYLNEFFTDSPLGRMNINILKAKLKDRLEEISK